MRCGDSSMGRAVGQPYKSSKKQTFVCVCFWRGILAARNSSVSVSSVCVGTVKCRLVLCATDDNDALPQPDTQTYGQTDRQTRYKKHRPWKRSGLSRCENLNQIGIVEMCGARTRYSMRGRSQRAHRHKSLEPRSAVRVMCIQFHVSLRRNKYTLAVQSRNPHLFLKLFTDIDGRKNYLLVWLILRRPPP